MFLTRNVVVQREGSGGASVIAGNCEDSTALSATRDVEDVCGQLRCAVLYIEICLGDIGGAQLVTGISCALGGRLSHERDDGETGNVS